ncbi:hypothetical protein RFI_38939 [Reticulomyxa filosa]|uniref:Uncharacterized protein n=1 Tax=Reticulomyxa filosa TaxID=46433 RepID=X6LCS6_RETFI|nr:hypothetical protein RFI_38939 [Reticulomyxa filosa]|eukprot:ETN98554.1 hypothetical protein RFI_38939 [Reticulomyxa filosa]
MQNLWNKNSAKQNLKTLENDKTGKRLIDNFQHTLSTMDRRLKHVSTVNDSCLEQLEQKCSHLHYHFKVGWEKHKNVLNEVKMCTNKQVLAPSEKMLEYLEKMESSVVSINDLEWVIQFPSDQSLLALTSMVSPLHRVGNIDWHCQLRKQFLPAEDRYKLGLFFGPSKIHSRAKVMSVKAKIEAPIVCKSQLPSSTSNEWKEETENFKLDADFIHAAPDSSDKSFMLRGKFFPLLQELIQENSGNFAPKNFEILVTFRVIHQNVCYYS